MSESEQQWDKRRLEELRRGPEPLLETAYRKLNDLQAQLPVAQQVKSVVAAKESDILITPTEAAIRLVKQSRSISSLQRVELESRD